LKRLKAGASEARNEQFGEWRGWERGITHVDMISPRVVTLEAMQLAWSPPTPEGGVEAGIGDYSGCCKR
jgi:carboxypeptidase Q